jgi:hypothetical protein
MRHSAVINIFAFAGSVSAIMYVFLVFSMDFQEKHLMQAFSNLEAAKQFAILRARPNMEQGEATAYEFIILDNDSHYRIVVEKGVLYDNASDATRLWGWS